MFKTLGKILGDLIDIFSFQDVTGFFGTLIVLSIVVISFLTRKRTGSFIKTAAFLLVVAILAEICFKIHWILFVLYICYMIFWIMRAYKRM